MESISLDGKIVIVTGAASDIGLGRAMTLALVRAGARVAMLDIDAEGLERTRAEVLEAGGRDCAIPIVGDVTSWDDAQRAVATTIRELGGLHVLINNAGINHRTAGFWELSPEAWTRTISVNLTGSFHMARAAVEHLKGQGWGRIIGVTTSFSTMLRSAPYGPSKAGHEALIASMAHDLRDTGVTVNALLPGGAADTHMIPPGRDRSQLIKPEVMQEPVVWLASDASNGFTGQRVIGQFWDSTLPTSECLAKATGPVGWPQLGGPSPDAR